MTQYTAYIKLSCFPFWLELKPQKTRKQAEAYAIQILEDAQTEVVKEA